MPTGPSGHFAANADASGSGEGVALNDAEASDTGKGVSTDEDVVDVSSGDEEDV
jgi:hypothetical protein